MTPAPFPRHLRLSLKRGLARHAFAEAHRAGGDAGAVVSSLQRIAPNDRATARAVRRLRKDRAVVACGLSGGAVVATVREVRAATTRCHGLDAFVEDALIFVRVAVTAGRRKVTTRIDAASFSLHALERFVERGGTDPRAGLLAAVDREADAILRQAARGSAIRDRDDTYRAAVAEGVWAGSEDLFEPDAAWGPAWAGRKVPVFSVRTFLGPEEMNPCVWLAWRDDPHLRIVA